MKLLLDTHIFIWWDSSPDKLKPSTLDIINNTENQIYLSLVSLWELQIKNQLGKLSLNRPLKNLIEDQVQNNELKILPIQQNHIFELNQLPLIHKDPFDRLLIAQCLQEKLVLVTQDSLLSKYQISVL